MHYKKREEIYAEGADAHAAYMADSLAMPFWLEVSKRPDFTHNRTHAARFRAIFNEIQQVTTLRQYPRWYRDRTAAPPSRSGLVFAAVELWLSCSVRLCVKSGGFVTAGPLEEATE